MRSGGILLETSDLSFHFVCVRLGDVPALCWSPSKKSLTYITGELVQIDHRDPGGRLGHYANNGDPHLGNLSAFDYKCQYGDLIILASDGIVDNFNPKIACGKSPKDCNIDADEWTPELLEEDTRRSLETFLQSICDSEGHISPIDLVTALSQHVMAFTKDMREWLENNPQTRPQSYEHPGKLDHATCICFKVGRWLEWKYQRILWLGWQDPNCILAKLPKDVLRQIISACFY
eukprot:TRINITY_DN4583_c0_g1_i1.p1 TRINITY_DN4583_c0_g1~~TRINITY_DN4583_c0_g1_i1.p1  ORF type:complete len:233 (+),score=34.44 TRINITY_DN4583_c0_g1_i1:567-1265(+)